MLLPDHETAVDFLNYEAISRTIVELLRDNRERALTIGIHGDWGAGKSSVLKMVETDLASDKKVACLWFNGWTFQGFDDAKTVLIEATITELCRQRSTVGKVKEMGAQLIKRIDWLKVAKRGVGLALNLHGLPSPDQIEAVMGSLGTLADQVGDISPEEIKAKLTEAKSFLKPAEAKHIPEEIHEFREEFRKLLDEAKVDQLVVLIDDLDRCLPATAIDTLEAIRLFLFVPKTAFLIGADEAMIEYAVRQHFPNLPLASGPISYTRNYRTRFTSTAFTVKVLRERGAICKNYCGWQPMSYDTQGSRISQSPDSCMAVTNDCCKQPALPTTNITKATCMLRTDRILLRQWRDDDRDQFSAMCADSLIMKYLGGPISHEKANAGIDRQMAAIDAGQPGLYAAERLSDRLFLGFIGMSEVTFDALFRGEWKISWRLARPFWGARLCKRRSTLQAVFCSAPRSSHSLSELLL